MIPKALPSIVGKGRSVALGGGGKIPCLSVASSEFLRLITMLQ